jgi:hypothetical protein
MAKFLFDVEQNNRLEQNGLLKRFSIDCYGKQPTLETMRAEKAEMFNKLANKKGTVEYERWFLKYSPSTSSRKTRYHKKPFRKNVWHKTQFKTRKSRGYFL